MAELAIIYWIPWSVGATVQKGPQTDAYVAQNNKNSAKTATQKSPKMALKWLFFQKWLMWLLS